jgi:hypothetical protein
LRRPSESSVKSRCIAVNITRRSVAVATAFIDAVMKEFDRHRHSIRNQRHPLAMIVFRLTEPVLAPLRVLPPIAGLDFSPMVLLIALRVLRRFW